MDSPGHDPISGAAWATIGEYHRHTYISVTSTLHQMAYPFTTMANIFNSWDSNDGPPHIVKCKKSEDGVWERLAALWFERGALSLPQ